MTAHPAAVPTRSGSGRKGRQRRAGISLADVELSGGVLADDLRNDAQRSKKHLKMCGMSRPMHPPTNVSPDKVEGALTLMPSLSVFVEQFARGLGRDERTTRGPRCLAVDRPR